MVDVSFILVNYNSSKLCFDVVSSIKEHTKKVKYEIIIVDNSNSGEEFNKLSSLSKDCILINAKENLGFGKGNNLGAKSASGKYLFFLNIDTFLVNDAASELFDFMEQRNDVAVSGPNLFSVDLKPNVSYEFKPKSLSSEFCPFSLIEKRLNKNYFFNHKAKPLKLKGYVSGAALFIRKNVFEKIGGFDERIFMYAEESLLCALIQKNLGLKIYNNPAAKIIHFEGKTFNGNSINRMKNYVEGNFLYYKILYGQQDALKYLKLSIKKLNKKIRFNRCFRKNCNLEEYQKQINVYQEKYNLENE